MSALGQKQTFAVHQPMSALPPKADMWGAARVSALGQERTLGYLFDDIVGASDQRMGDSDPERLGSLEVYDQFDFCGLLDR
jgi:hypothetical protein